MRNPVVLLLVVTAQEGGYVLVATAGSVISREAGQCGSRWQSMFDWRMTWDLAAAAT